MVERVEDGVSKIQSMSQLEVGSASYKAGIPLATAIQSTRAPLHTIIIGHDA